MAITREEHAARLAALGEVGADADARAAEIRAARCLPGDLVARLVDTGVFRTWVPEAYGGPGGTAMDLYDAIETLAYQEASAGWVVMVAGTTALVSGFLAPAWAQEIYGDPRAVTAGFAAPVGRARPVDGGLEVSGRWSWGSGVTHCTWIVGGVVVSDDGEGSAVRSDGLRTPLVFLPAADVTIHDTWHPLGLAGSGSVDYEVAGAFVPEGRWAPFPMRAPVVDAPLYRFTPIGALAAGVAFVTVGLARRAVDELMALAAHKVPGGAARTLAERPAVQSQVIEAEAAWRSARAVLREEVARCWAEAEGEGDITDEARRALRVAAINAVERSARAVDIAYHAGGGSAIHDDSVLQRLFRDVHTATAHGANSPLLTERLGRMAMGIATDSGLV